MAAIDLETFPTNREDADEVKWSSIMSSKYQDGVYYALTGYNDLLVYSDQTGLQVKVKTGQVFIGGFDALSPGVITLPLLAADGTYDRIDRVVARLDRDDPSTIQLDVLTGTPALNPAVPTLTKTSTITEISLSQIRVPARASTILANNVTDNRVFTAPRGHGSALPGVMGTTTGGAGVSPFTSPIDHWHPLDPLLTRQLVQDAGEYIPAGHGAVGIGRIPADGRIVSRVEYSRLFQKFGVTYGAGDGSTTFQLPDARRCVLRGAGVDQVVGQLKGSDTVTIVPDNLPPNLGLDDRYQFVIASPFGEEHQIATSGAPGNTNVTYSTAVGTDPAVPISVIQRSIGVNWLLTT